MEKISEYNMIQNYKEWVVETENFDFLNKIEGLEGLSKVIDQIKKIEIHNLDTQLDKVKQDSKKKGLEAWGYYDSPIRYENDTISQKVRFEIYYTDDDFVPDKDVFGGLVVVKGRDAAEAYVTNILKELKIEYEVIKGELKTPLGKVKRLQMEIYISMKSSLATFIKTFEHNHRAVIHGKTFGI